MAWKFEVATTKTAAAFTDRTSLVDRTQIALGGRAWDGEAQPGTIYLGSDAGAIALPPHRVCRWIEDATTPDTTLWRGRREVNDLARGTRWDGDALAYEMSVGDANLHLRGIPVVNWDRPAETDYARVIALAAAFLAGTPRVSTNLATTWVANANLVSLPKRKYNGSPLEVLQDITRESGKLYFVTMDDELFYDLESSANYSAGLSVTDVAASVNYTTVFAPIEPQANMDAQEYLSGGALLYRDDRVVTETRISVEDAGDFWREVIFDGDVQDASQATQLLAKILDTRDQEDDRYTFSLELLSTQVDLIKHGQRMSFRSAACGVTTPITRRIATLTWQEIGDGKYRADIDLTIPPKVSRRLKRKAPPPNPGVPELIYVTDDTDTCSRGSTNPSWGTPDGVPLSWTTTNNSGAVVNVAGGFCNIGLATDDPGSATVTLTGSSLGSLSNVNILLQHLFTLTAPLPSGTDFTIVLGAGINLLWQSNSPNQWTVRYGTATGLLDTSAIAMGDLWLMRIEVTSTIIRVKAWQQGTAEPSAWGVTVTKSGAASLGDFAFDVITPTGSSFNIYHLDNLKISELNGISTAASGAIVSRTTIGIGDGTETNFEFPGAQAVAPGSVSVWVDGLSITPSLIDHAAGIIIFGTAPASGEVVEASWQID